MVGVLEKCDGTRCPHLGVVVNVVISSPVRFQRGIFGSGQPWVREQIPAMPKIQNLVVESLGSLGAVAAVGNRGLECDRLQRLLRSIALALVWRLSPVGGSWQRAIAGDGGSVENLPVGG